MRLGLFGGTFDPVHYGHLLLAEQCKEQCKLNEIHFIPAGDPPHKEKGIMTAGKKRVEMLEFATACAPSFHVNKIELEREGTTYTVDTLQAIQAEQPGAELFFLMGADSLDDLPTWKNPEEIAQFATIVAVNRGGESLPTLTGITNALGEEIAASIQFVTIPSVSFSSSDIRQRIAEDRSIRYMVPRAVEAYIWEQRLYG